MGAITLSRTTLGPRFSEGARLLWDAMSRLSLSQWGLTRLLGTKPGVVSRWLYGDTRPGWDWANKILSACDVPLDAWTKPSSVRFVPPAARKAKVVRRGAA